MYYNYPKIENADDLFSCFKDRSTTNTFLYNLRWKNGFVCDCGWKKLSKYNGKSMIYCPKCKYKTSITAGTLFDKSRIPLDVLLYGLWKFSTFEGITAKKLQPEMNLKSYKDAWRWASKFRELCIDPSIKLKGQVYLTLISIGRRMYYQGYRIDHHDGYVSLLAETNNKLIDKIVLKYYEDFNPEDPDPSHVNKLLADHLDEDAVIITHDLFSKETYNVTQWRHKFIRNKKNPGFDIPLVVKETAKELVTWMKNRMGDRFWEKHLNSYLDEFSFKHNNIDMLESGQFFYKLLDIALQKKIKPLQ